MPNRVLRSTLAALLLALLASGLGQAVPQTPDEVARPGGDLPGDPQIALVRITDGLNDPTGVTSAFDGSGRIFVTERAGFVRIVRQDGTLQEEPFLDLTSFNPLGSDVQTGFVEQGLFSIAFHPNFAENGHFYVHYTSLPFNGDNMIVRFTVDPDSPDVVTNDRLMETSKVILRVEQPYYNHNGGQITFGPDGYLYIGIGDGGWEGDPLNAGQSWDTLLGKLLRIDVDVPEDEIRHYRIPEDNPWAHAPDERLMILFGISEEEFDRIKTEAKREIWAYGLRNPYLFHFDRETGDLFIADVGQNHWEEINWQPADSQGGENYGWRHNMGTHCHPLLGPDQECPQVGVLPAAEYPHETPYPGAEPLEDGFGCSAQGLGVSQTAGLEGVYLVGDWCTGRLWGLGWDDESGAWQFEELLQTDLQFTGGGNDEDGSVLVVDCECFYTADQGPLENPPGSLWRVMAADEVPEGAETARARAQRTDDGDAESGEGDDQDGDGDAQDGEPGDGEQPGGEPGDGDGDGDGAGDSGGDGEREGETAAGETAEGETAEGETAEGVSQDERVTLRHPLDDEPLDIGLPEGEARTEAVAHFHRTGENLYAPGETPEAVQEGRALFLEHCASCHEPDGAGRIGPSLIDDRFRYARTDEAIGMFEVIHAGATGAMQPFGDRLSQDQILKIMAYVQQLRQEAN